MIKNLPRNIFLVVQEGGSSTEMYVHTHDTKRQARADRRSCAKAAYRTSEPIKVPEVLTRILNDFPGAEVEFYEVLKTVLTADLNYPEMSNNV